ncbi:MAG: S41 family peptidase, partial [Myxococcota bacterium]
MLSLLDKQTRLVNLSGRRRRDRLVSRGLVGIGYERGRSKHVVIRRIFPGSPAEMSGLRKGDRIVSVEGETLKPSISLRSISRRMQGFRGTRLALEILRKGWSKSKRVVLIRAKLSHPLVTGFLLPGGVAYVRLTRFAGGSAIAIREQLGRLRQQLGTDGSFSGLILDLRNNPGGRVTEAVAICSMFVQSGQVVSFAGANQKRKDFKVSGKNVEEGYPMAVLVNGRSASASELLSGALREQRRAVILGQQSYGKGTVQRVGRVLGGRFFMAVTIAQYLLPGDVSIQGKGVIPDISLFPVRVRKGDMMYARMLWDSRAERRKRWPRFLQQNLESVQKLGPHLFYVQRERTRKTSKKVTPQSVKKAIPKLRASKGSVSRRAAQVRTAMAKRWLMSAQPEALEGDFEVWFARYLLTEVKSARRSEILHKAKRVLKHLHRQEGRLLANRFAKQGIDWSMPLGRSIQRIRVRKALKIRGTLSHPTVNEGRLPLGQRVPFTLRVVNQGTTALSRVRARIVTSWRPLRNREFLLGKLAPGKTVTQTFFVYVSAFYRKQARYIRVVLEGEQIPTMTLLERLLLLDASPLPKFHFVERLEDPAPDGNQDGFWQPGERVRLSLWLQNYSGVATSSKFVVTLMVPQLNIRKHWRAGTMQSKEQRFVSTLMHIPDRFRSKKILFLLRFFDVQKGLLRTQRFLLPTRAQESLSKPVSGNATALQALSLWKTPLRRVALGTVKKGSHFRLLARRNQMLL